MISLLKRFALFACAGLWFLVVANALLLIPAEFPATAAELLSWREEEDEQPFETGNVGIDSTRRSRRCSGRSSREEAAVIPPSRRDSDDRDELERFSRPLPEGRNGGDAGGGTDPGGRFSLTFLPTADLSLPVILITFAQFFLLSCSAVAMRSRVFSYESSLAWICILWTRAPRLSSSRLPLPDWRIQSNDPCCNDASLSSDETLKPKLRVESCRRLGMWIVYGKNKWKLINNTLLHCW